MRRRRNLLMTEIPSRQRRRTIITMNFLLRKSRGSSTERWTKRRMTMRLNSWNWSIYGGSLKSLRREARRRLPLTRRIRTSLSRTRRSVSRKRRTTRRSTKRNSKKSRGSISATTSLKKRRNTLRRVMRLTRSTETRSRLPVMMRRRNCASRKLTNRRRWHLPRSTDRSTKMKTGMCYRGWRRTLRNG